MPSTTIHFPGRLLEELDTAAKERGMSRKRYVIEACRQALDKEEGRWPNGFFTQDLSDDDLSLLREAAEEMERSIYSHWHNRGAPLL